MKILLIILAAGVISAQTIYKVTPGTNDNKIILTVENASTETEMTDIKTSLYERPEAISFKQAEQKIEKIEKQKSKDIEFIFDVNRIVNANKVDTLMFVINSKSGKWSKEILIGYELPKEFTLEQNYPNPFNPETKIGYQVPVDSKLTLKIYDILGREVVTLVDEKQVAGYYEKIFTAQNLASGMYIYRLSGENINLVKKMILMK
jgi:hypothetical protein